MTFVSMEECLYRQKVKNETILLMLENIYNFNLNNYCNKSYTCTGMNDNVNKNISNITEGGFSLPMNEP